VFGMNDFGQAGNIAEFLCRLPFAMQLRQAAAALLHW
jgi:hypothetical protein